MTSSYSFALVSEPYTGTADEVRPIQGIKIFQFPGSDKVKSCILSKSHSLPTLGLSQYSTSNLCVVQVNAGARKVYLASVYIEPGMDGAGTLERVEHFLKDVGGTRCIVGGDFNGWHPLWGSHKANERGNCIVELAYSNNLFCCNTGNTPTFETVTHGRDRSSIIDITLASSDIFDCITDWKVNIDACASSQHNAIDFTLKLDNTHRQQHDNTSTFKYKNDKAHWEHFKSSLHLHISTSDVLDRNVTHMNKHQIDDIINQITEIIHAACKDSIPEKASGSAHKPPWWSDELETLKEEVIRSHRNLHTAKKHFLPTDSLAEEHADLKSKYAVQLRSASSANFRNFCELQTKENVWSLTNRLLKDSNPRRPPTTLKVGNEHTTDSKETARALLNHFYPDDSTDTLHRHHELRQRIHDPTTTPDDPPFTTGEVLEALKFMNPKKAPGLDSLTSDICLQFATAYPQLLTDILNRCLTLQYFPEKWKTAYIKIIPKPNKSDYTSLNSHRPIGLIPVFGKLLEKLFISRVTYAAAKAGKSNPRQFGFKPQTSTTMAIDTALQTIRQAKARGEMVLAVSLDIKAAFDNAWWPALLNRLRLTDCPNNIFHLIKSYLEDRKVVLDHANTRATKTMSKGCIQGSTCGPILWNIILDELLNEDMPNGSHIQAFADDVLLITHAKHIDDLQEVTNKALETVVRWGKGAKLEFGPAKTKLIAFTPKAKVATVTMEGQTLPFESEIKFLGVVLDEKLLFNKHVLYIINKATRIFNKLCLYCRPTWGAHTENVQTIYRQVIEPIVTYAAGIWGHAAYKKGIRKKLLSMQRAFAIKAIKSYRTVSTPAAIALAQFTPLDLKVREIHTIEKSKLTHVTDLLPHDITLEHPTPPHELLHPSERITLTTKSYTDNDQITYDTTPDQIQIYTDGSKLEGSAVGAAFVCWDGNRVTETRKYRLHNSCSVFQAELLAIHKACLWASNTYPFKHIKIFTDSSSSTLALANRSNTHPLVSRIHNTIHNHAGTIEMAWVRSHVGIPGNEAADVAAKNAATMHKSPEYAAFPITYVKHNTRTNHRETWQNRYDSATQGRHTHRLLPKLADIDKLFKMTKHNFYLTQILTGHGYHKKYLRRFGITDSDACPCDGTTVQSLEHLLEECPRFDYARLNHTMTCDNLRVLPFKLNELMTKPSALESFIRFSTSILKNLKAFNEGTI